MKLQGGDQAGAFAAYQESLDIRRKLATQHQDNAQAQIDLVVSLYKVSAVADPSQARVLLTEALSIVEKLEQEQKLTAAQKNWPNSSGPRCRSCLEIIPLHFDQRGMRSA